MGGLELNAMRDNPTTGKFTVEAAATWMPPSSPSPANVTHIGGGREGGVGNNVGGANSGSAAALCAVVGGERAEGEATVECGVVVGRTRRRGRVQHK
jgi:hypothetical protein